MQINVDDEVFHKWALSKGYARLTDLIAWVEQKRATEFVAQVEIDTLAAEAAALEQLDDLKPVPSLKEVTDALRQVLDVKGAEVALQLLADFGATKIGDVPEARRADFKAAAERLMS